MRRLLATVAALTLLSRAHLASGQGAPQDRAAAQALFDEARTLDEAGNRDGACEKFTASLHIEQAVGTLLNVAACDERQGRLATAWLRYREAESLAASRGDERTKIAAEGAAEVAMRMGHVRVHAAVGVVVRRNGVFMAPELRGTAVPVDAESHLFEASAPGRQTWHAVVVTVDGETTIVDVPELAPAPEARVTPASSRASLAAASSRTSTAALVVGGVGLGTLIAGGVFGVLTITKNAAADDTCLATKNASAERGEFDPVTGRCYAPSAALDDANARKAEARLFANLANVLVPAGLVGVGLGVYLALRTGGSGGVSARVVPSLTGASLEGRF